MDTNVFSLGEHILPDDNTRDVELSNSMAQLMKIRCCVFNKVFLVNHGRDIFNCSYKWLCLSKWLCLICA